MLNLANAIRDATATEDFVSYSLKCLLIILTIFKSFSYRFEKYPQTFMQNMQSWQRSEKKCNLKSVKQTLMCIKSLAGFSPYLSDLYHC